MTLWTVGHQAPLSMCFSRQEYWSGLPCPPPRDPPDPGIKATSLTSPAMAGGFFTTSATWEAYTVLCLVAQSCPTLCNPVDCSPSGSSVHGDTPGKNIRVGCPPPGIFPTQGLNPGLSHCRWIFYCLSHQGSPRILEWVALPFSWGSSQPRN